MSFGVSFTIHSMFKLFESNRADVTHITHHQIERQYIEIVRTARKNSIALKMRAEHPVILVPKHYSDQQLTRVLSNHQVWLEQNLVELKQRHLSQLEPAVFNGEWGASFEFLGQSVKLVRGREKQGEASLLKSGNSGVNIHASSQVWITGQQCHIIETLQNGSQRCAAIEAFMIQSALEYLRTQLNNYARQIGVTYQSIKVRGYKSRWGSCYPDGRLQFNWRLMQAPTWVIDYVVVHELCHLVHPDHSRNFWALVQAHYPKTHEAKAYIKQHGKQWIAFLQK